MKKCPNCDRPTKRTLDWACQWCGYPLVSKSYKEIPKTFRQLKEERLLEKKQKSLLSEDTTMTAD
jgi:ribosomal protein L37AE/L43A